MDGHRPLLGTSRLWPIAVLLALLLRHHQGGVMMAEEILQ